MFGCLRGVVAFALVLLAPGYCVAWVCDSPGISRARTVERLAWGVALSFAVVPIAAVMIGEVRVAGRGLLGRWIMRAPDSVG